MAQSNSKPPTGQNFGLGGLHSKSSAQSLSYGNNGFSPFSPLPQSESSLASSPSVKDASMEEVDVSSRGPSLMLGSSSSFIERKFISNFDSLPPRNGHRRANSDVPLGFDAFIQTTPQLVPISNTGVFGKGGSFGNDEPGFDKAMNLEKHEKDMIRDGKSISDGVEERKCEGEVIDGFFSSYMNLDITDRCHVSGGEDTEKGSLIRGGIRRSLNMEGEILSVGNFSNNHGMPSREPNKRSADGDLAPTTRHFRSLSVDSAFGNLNFGNESPNLADGRHMSKLLPANSGNEISAKFSLGFGNGDFTESELKRIQADERLAEIAFSDPKRVKRILANRQSAARSKERKMRYITELEHKVQTLQTEAANLSTQLTTLQKDIRELTNHNSELKFRLKAMDQQARLRDALHEALAAEVKHLKLAAMEMGQDGGESTRISQQTPIKHQMLHMDCQQFSAGTSKSATTTSPPTPASA